MKSRISMQISCKTCPVGKLCLSKGMDEEEIKLLDKNIDYINTFQPANHLYLANDKLTHLYAIYDGICKDYYIDENGDECVNNFYFPGDIIGLEFINKEHYPFYVVSLKNTVACAIPVEKFKAIMQTNPSFQNRVLDMLCGRIRNGIKAQLNSASATQKVASFYLNVIKREKKIHPTLRQIPVNIPQIDISNKLKLANETFSRVLHSLMKDNVIKIKNHKIQHAEVNQLEKLAFSMAKKKQLA